MHVLIGPNDSGKTSILDVLAALCRSVDHDLSQAFLGSWKRAELVWAGHAGSKVSIEVNFDDAVITGYGIDILFGTQGRQATVVVEYIEKEGTHYKQDYRAIHTSVCRLLLNPSWSCPHSNELKAVAELLEGVHYYHWNPSFLALPVAPDSERRFRMESNGFGLALFLDEILSFDRDRFNQLEKRFVEIFPHIKSIVLQQAKAYRAPIDNPEQVTVLQQADGKGLYFKLKESGQLVPASQASDGTLLILAYLSVLYLPEPPRLLLVEEPENGIHPNRLREILSVLRELIKEQSHTQIVLTTHSPYVLDLFKPEEVTLCTKLKSGAIKTLQLSDSDTVKKQLDVFTLGEIWTSEGDMAIAEPETMKKKE